MSRRTVTCLSHRNHVSEANFAGRNVATSPSRDVFESLIFRSTSVHVERMNSVLAASSSYFFAGVPVATPREGPCVSSIAAAFQAAANPLQAEGISPWTGKASGETSLACGGKESRINRFTIYPEDVQKFAECDVATTLGPTNSFHIPNPPRMSPNDGSYCMLNPCNVVAQLVTSQACYSRHDSDILLTLRRLGPKSDHEKIARIILLFPTLAHTEKRTSRNSRNLPHLQCSTYGSLILEQKFALCSYHPSVAMSWIREIEAARDISDLRTFLSITGTYHPILEMR